MKKVQILTIVLVLFLVACGYIGNRSASASVPNNPEAKAIQTIVDKYIAAIQAYDADALAPLYADNSVWEDFGNSFGPLNKADLSYFYHQDWKSADNKLEFKSYFVTVNGRFAIAQAIFSRVAPSTNTWASTPAVIVLEFKDNKIVNESWYYNESLFH